jgi:hypothetical protein
MHTQVMVFRQLVLSVMTIMVSVVVTVVMAMMMMIVTLSKVHHQQKANVIAPQTELLLLQVRVHMPTISVRCTIM